MKEANCSKYVQKQNAKRDAVRKNRNNKLEPNKTIVSVLGSNAPSAQANLLITSRMAQFSQPCASLAAPPAVPIRAPTTTIFAAFTSSAPLKLSKKEIEKLKKFEKCYNCKQKKHAAWRCIQPARLYLAISAQLQEIELVEEANQLGKK